MSASININLRLPLWYFRSPSVITSTHGRSFPFPQVFLHRLQNTYTNTYIYKVSHPFSSWCLWPAAGRDRIRNACRGPADGQARRLATQVAGWWRWARRAENLHDGERNVEVDPIRLYVRLFERLLDESGKVKAVVSSVVKWYWIIVCAFLMKFCSYCMNFIFCIFFHAPTDFFYSAQIALFWFLSVVFMVRVARTLIFLLSQSRKNSESQEVDWPGVWCYGLDQNKCMVLSTPV